MAKRLYSDDRELGSLPDELFTSMMGRYDTKTEAEKYSKKVNSYAKANGLKLKTGVDKTVGKWEIHLK